MSFFHDRFLATVLGVTGVIILGMFVLHRTLGGGPRPPVASENISITHPQLPVQNQPKEPSPPSKGPFRVKQVLDGDTIILDNGETIRLIGVDAPEIHHPEIPVQRFGEEAKEFLRRLTEGFDYILEYEPGNLRDKYGRLLAYVFVEDRLVNAEMIRHGYAYAYTRFPYQRQAEFLTLEQEARETQSGLWHLSLSESQVPPRKGGIISWRDAAQYYGEYATVEGTVVATHNSGKACYLNFHPDYKRYFTAVIFGSAFSRLPSHPESYYDGKKVRVSGFIKEYNGKPEMILNDPTQIEILE